MKKGIGKGMKLFLCTALTPTDLFENGLRLQRLLHRAVSMYAGHASGISDCAVDTYNELQWSYDEDESC